MPTPQEEKFRVFITWYANLGLFTVKPLLLSQKWLKNLTIIDFRLNPLPANDMSANQHTK